MAGSLNDIRRLLPLMEMAYQAEQMKMATILTRIRGLKAQLQELERPVTESADTMSAATRAGADLLWQTWAQDRKALINRELALASRDREGARVNMVRALSKFEAAKQMELRAKADALRTVQRRSSW